MTRKIILPILHDGQKYAHAMHLKHRLTIFRCGRRFGKTLLMQAIACNHAPRGNRAAYFAPSYKLITPFYKDCKRCLKEEIESSNQTDGLIETKRGGQVEVWTLENEDAGRSRRYHIAMIDEASLCKGEKIFDTYEKAIMPTLLDFGGSLIIAGTPKGVMPGDFFYELCNDKDRYGFKEVHLPTSSNPHMSASNLAALKSITHPLVWEQEYEAKFVDWRGVRFFDIDKMLIDGKPIAMPLKVDVIYAVIDSATKTGKEHDGTAVLYCAIDSTNPKYKLIILDYDIVQIEGSLLETWLPTVYEKLEFYSNLCGSRHGHAGTLIEDKASGMILIQQAKRRGWKVTPIDSKLTSVGKDERAISISGYVWQGIVKITNTVYDKIISYKERKRNHFLMQIVDFQIGDKDAAKREDDLLDTFCYAVALGIGNSRGF